MPSAVSAAHCLSCVKDWTSSPSRESVNLRFIRLQLRLEFLASPVHAGLQYQCAPLRCTGQSGFPALECDAVEIGVSCVPTPYSADSRTAATRRPRAAPRLFRAIPPSILRVPDLEVKHYPQLSPILSTDAPCDTSRVHPFDIMSRSGVPQFRASYARIVLNALLVLHLGTSIHVSNLSQCSVESASRPPLS
jgi:hypothetical protein